MSTLRYLHTCLSCGEAFDDEINTPKEDSYCCHCTMLPELNDKHYHVDAPAGISPGGRRLIHTKGEENAEVIDSGLTGLRVKGTANLAASKPQRHHIFKKKNCKNCQKIFEPDSGNCKHCPDCRKLPIVKVRQAKLYLKEQETPHTGQGRHVNKPNKVTLEKLADGLISEATGKPANRITDAYTTGLNLLKKQDTIGELPGLWVRYKDSGLTYDKRQYVTSKELITGQVCIDLWNPRERYVSDSTANRLDGPSLAPV